MKVSMRLQRSILRGIFAALTIISAPVLAADFYVATDGNDGNPGTSALPFATIGAAITAADSAIAGGDGSATIHVADGTYTTSGLMNITNAISIIGNVSSPSSVNVRNNTTEAQTVSTTFLMSHADAALKGIKISGYGATSGEVYGGHIRMTAGLVEDCEITTGGGTSRGFVGGGNIHMTGGTVRRCKVTNGYGRRKKGGGNIYAEGGVVENCLIKGGRGNGNNDSGYPGAGIRVDGDAKVVNCTIVGNTESAYRGVYCGSSNARIVNCVIYDNGGTAAAEWGNSNPACFINCAFANGVASDAMTLASSGLLAGDFVDYAGGDYRPAVSAALLDKGTDPSAYATGTSATDLAGVSRVSPANGTIDIGCYEYQQSGGALVMGSIAPTTPMQGDTVVCSAATLGASGTIRYKWDFDDGEPIVTDEATISYTYSRTGIHNNKIYLSTDGGETWSVQNNLENYVATVVPTNIYVKETNDGAAYPYDSDATATTDIDAAMSLAMLATDQGLGTVCTVHIADGTYTPQVAYTFSAPIVVIGNAAIPSNVVLNNTKNNRAFNLNNASAAVKGVRIIGNGRYDGDNKGGHIYMSAGLVEDCEIDAGGARSGNGYVGGGNIYMDGGMVRRCKVTNGWGRRVKGGGNIYAGGGVVENCLIKGGRCDGDSSTTYHGAGIRVDGSAKVVNCTIIGNSASKYRGVYCGSSSASVVNCAIYDNGGTSAFEWGANNAARFVNCAVASSAADGFTGDGCIATLTDAAFTDYANADYTPAKDGALVNAGTKWDEYLSFGATSETDLAGAARLSGKFLDIGCYEIASGVGLSIFVR